MKVLVTGGCGFIGSHVVDLLVDRGDDVVVIDSLEPQVHHGSQGWRNADARYVDAPLTWTERLDTTIEGCDAVVHLAAQVGVGQSLEEPTRYVYGNCSGTASLLQAIDRAGTVESLFVASSMSVYGEGKYQYGTNWQVGRPPRRDPRPGHWNPGGVSSVPMPLIEDDELKPESVYALTKRFQEELCLLWGAQKGIRTSAGRFFNVVGPRQSQNNPYTGVAAMFLGAIDRGEKFEVFEDGMQMRDFISVHDVARAVVLMLDAGKGVYNVCTGKPTRLIDLLMFICVEKRLTFDTLEVTQRYRPGDVRHVFGSNQRLRSLGWDPEVEFEDMITELVAHSQNDRS